MAACYSPDMEHHQQVVPLTCVLDCSILLCSQNKTKQKNSLGRLFLFFFFSFLMSIPFLATDDGETWPKEERRRKHKQTSYYKTWRDKNHLVSVCLSLLSSCCFHHQQQHFHQDNAYFFIGFSCYQAPLQRMQVRSCNNNKPKRNQW